MSRRAARKIFAVVDTYGRIVDGINEFRFVGGVLAARLLPHVPENAIAILELTPGTPEEQVIASRHLWNSYAAASV